MWDVCGVGSPIVWKVAKGTEIAVNNSYGPLLQLELGNMRTFQGILKSCEGLGQ